MSIFSRKSSKPPPEQIERKADSLRPGATPERIEVEEVTGLIDLTLERLSAAQEASTNALTAATRKLESETLNTIATVRRFSAPPKK